MLLMHSWPSGHSVSAPQETLHSPTRPPGGMAQLLLMGQSVSVWHSLTGSQTRFTQRSVVLPQSTSCTHSETHSLSRGSQVVPNGQTCCTDTHLPCAVSQRWLASPQSALALQVRSESGTQPAKLLQVAGWPVLVLSGQHCLTAPLSWQVAPRGQSVVAVQAVPQNFRLSVVSRMQLSPMPPHSRSFTQLWQKLLSGRHERVEASQNSVAAHSESALQPVISVTHRPV